MDEVLFLSWLEDQMVHQCTLNTHKFRIQAKWDRLRLG